MAQSTPAAVTALPIEPVWDPHTPQLLSTQLTHVNQNDPSDEEDLDSSWGGDMLVF